MPKRRRFLEPYLTLISRYRAPRYQSRSSDNEANQTAAISMRPNIVERTISFLMSSILLLAIGVTILGFLFIQWQPQHRSDKGITTTTGPGKHDVNTDGIGQDFDLPGNDETQLLSEPSMEQTLQFVSTTVSSVVASLESIDSESNTGGNGSSGSRYRRIGRGGGNNEPTNRFERWELKFSARDKRSYARQLDYFQIELAAIGGGHSTIDYASSLAGAPSHRSGTGESESRLYFMYRNQNALQQYDRALLKAAGVETEGRVFLKFIPEATEEQLAKAEAAYFREKRSREFNAAQIAKTVFECRMGTDGQPYEWVVVAQFYHGHARP